MFKQNEEREGALLRRLKEAGRTERPGNLGFATGLETGPKKRAMVVVAQVADGPDLATRARELIEAGVEGIEIVVGGRTDTGALTEAVRAMGTPCGLLLTGASKGDLSALAAIEGLDWLHLGADAPAALLAGPGPTRLVGISPDSPSGRLPGVNGLKADVVVAEGAGSGRNGSSSGNSPFTIDTLLAVRTIQGATRGPILVGDGLGLSPDDITVLHDHGVEGVLVADGPDAVHAFITAVDKL